MGSQKNGLKKVLVIEDRESIFELFLCELEDTGISLLSARTIPEAEILYTENSDLSAIGFDACVPGSEPNTGPLVAKIKSTYNGPMFAISNDPSYRQLLMSAGCNYECAKEIFPKKLIEILGL